MQYKCLFLFTLVFLGAMALSAQDVQKADTLEVEEFVFVEDNPFVQMLDSMISIRFFNGNDNFAESSFQWSSDSVPVFCDSVYIHRIREMNEKSPFEFVYNQDIRNFIELYGLRRRHSTQRILGLMEFYSPIFEEHLDKYNIPLELKYVAVIESALNPVARSRAGAVGLWQFIPGTGRLYNLEINREIDERSDVYKATDAACRYLSDLYKMYNDWSLVLAAYNAGPGNVNRAIRRAGSNQGYWHIRRFLPRETQGYVPVFIAAAYIMTYANEHNLIPQKSLMTAHEVDTIVVRTPVRFEQLTEILDISIDEIEFLNPSYRRKIINASEENPMVLRLPKKQMADFINNRDIVLNHGTIAASAQESRHVSSHDVRNHTVKRGESLNIIARRYSITVDDLKLWNGLRSNLIHPGQQLRVSPPIAQSGDQSAQNI